MFPPPNFFKTSILKESHNRQGFSRQEKYLFIPVSDIFYIDFAGVIIRPPDKWPYFSRKVKGLKKTLMITFSHTRCVKASASKTIITFHRV
jgi:hypothetical protein